MCTVIYYPGKDGILFSSCRDEDPARPLALLPAFYKAGDRSAVYPKDGTAGGTWAGMNDEGDVIILLNGAFEKHVREKEYRKSRGLIVRDLLFAVDVIDQWTIYDLRNIEPFTLVIRHQKKLYEAVWNAEQIMLTEMDPRLPHIWSSSTLYDKNAQKIRRQWFNEGLKRNAIKDIPSLQSFLLAHNDPGNGFVMKRHERLATLSISCFRFCDSRVSLYYNDLIKKEESELSLSIKADVLQ